MAAQEARQPLEDRSSMSSTGIASQTQLPPSPELTGINPLVGPPLLDLSSSFDIVARDGSAHGIPRLMSIADYESFQPQALACSPPIVESYSGLEDGPGKGPDRSDGQHGASSLGAVAGSHGVALFRLLQPQSPVMVLSHAFHSDTKWGGVSLLSFQPSASRSLHLASSRGTGVLIWDVSGHSLSPLLGRLGMDVGSGLDHSPIVSLAWQPPDPSDSSSAPVLSATTEFSACLWDLRQHSSAATFRPSLRFGLQRGSEGTAASSAPYVQISCARQNECAILDASGVLRIFDTRMTDRNRTSLGALCSFSAMHHSGVGLSNLRTSNHRDCWVTWGIDAPGADTVVKVWSRSTDHATRSKSDADDSWFMDTVSPPPSFIQSASSSVSRTYDLVGKCASRNLACARVCPSPIADSIVTVGFCSEDESSTSKWRANLWKLVLSSETGASRLEPLVSFTGGRDVEKRLGTMVGKESAIGGLCAAELALSSLVVSPETGVRAGDDRNDSMNLLLCTLTEKGFIATHIIPEAIPRPPSQGQERRYSPKREGSNVVSIPPTTRRFPSDREVAMNDAARIWNRSGYEAEGADKRVESERHDTQGNQTFMEGASLPFDMDSPPFAKKSVMTGITGDYIVSTVISGQMSTDDKEQRSADQADAVALMKSIETDRIPCPRLCGASFGVGVGGLALFHNGDVRKVWSWWERNHPTRLSSVPGLIGEPAPHEPRRSYPASAASPLNGGNSGDAKKSGSRDFPRTLKDLNDMTNAARAAQWGDQDDSDASAGGFRALGDNFFEEGSDASSDSADEQADDFLGDGSEGKEPSTDMYNRYFGGFQRPTAVAVLSEEGSEGRDQEKSDIEVLLQETLVGASSDMLAPVVKVFYSYDDLALNRQSPTLASRWMLGDIDSIADIPRYDHSNSLLSMSGRHSLGISEKTSRRVLTTEPVFRETDGPSMKSRLASYADDERGVHGGEYSVRPNMQESIFFLKKLSATAASKLLSPIDEPMLPQGLTKSGLWSQGGVSVSSRKGSVEKTEENSKVQPGVYILDKVPVAVEVQRELQDTKDLCLHNAEVCNSLGEQEKFKVWSLLAQMVDMRLTESNTNLDGWGRFGGSAFTQALVENLFRYYESLGDVQMLSTIVCVLRGSKRQQLDTPSLRLLPENRDEQYDMFIRRYADLLYGWGLLTICAEVKKHLVRATPNIEISQWVSGQEADEGRTPGICVVFSCPRCGGETEPGTNYCSSCQDYAFRCVICDNSVRGLFTICRSCGHGGHVGHMKEWFASREDCPSGCGCKCMAVRSQYHANMVPGPSPKTIPMDGLS